MGFSGPGFWPSWKRWKQYNPHIHVCLRWDSKQCTPLNTLTASSPGLQWVLFYSPDSCTANRWVQPSTVSCMGLSYWHPRHLTVHSPQWKCFLAGKKKKSEKGLVCFNRERERWKNTAVFLVGRTEKGQDSSWKVDERGRREHWERLRKKSRKAQAVRLRTKAGKSRPEAGSCPSVTSSCWPPLAHGGPGVMFAIGTASTSTQATWLVSAEPDSQTLSRERLCIWHSCSDTEVQTSFTLSHTPFSLYRQKECTILLVLLQHFSSAPWVTESTILLGKRRMLCPSDTPYPLRWKHCEGPFTSWWHPFNWSWRRAWPAAGERRCGWNVAGTGSGGQRTQERADGVQLHPKPYLHFFLQGQVPLQAAFYHIHGHWQLLGNLRASPDQHRIAAIQELVAKHEIFFPVLHHIL